MLSQMKTTKSGTKIVYMGGTWDVLNYGHCLAFQMCKTFGGHLIVGLNTDELVREYKKMNPVLPYEQKKFILESIRYVDKVIPVHEFSPMSILDKLRPDVFCVGSDWADTHLKEFDFIKSYGGTVEIIPRFDGVVTTGMMKRILLEEVANGNFVMNDMM